MQRMQEEKDFDLISPVFLPPHKRWPAPSFAGKDCGALESAYDIDALKAMDIIITCQGGDYTKRCILSCWPRVGMATGLTPLCFAHERRCRHHS